MRPGEPIEAMMEETDAEFDDRLCRVIAKAETTIYTEAYVRKPLAQGSAPSHNALACIADGGIWHEFVPATPADTQGRFRLVLFKFSENGPSAIGFFAGWAKPVQLSFAAKTAAVRRSSYEVCQDAMDYWACRWASRGPVRGRDQDSDPKGRSPDIAKSILLA